MTVHIASNRIIVEGRYHRQRCVWCGALLIDDDLAMQMVEVTHAHEEPPSWPVGGLVRIEGENPRHSSAVDSEKLPNDCCYCLGMAREEG